MVRRLAFTAVAAAMAASGIALAAPASAAPMDSRPTSIENGSPYTLQLLGVEGGGHFEGRPGDGAVLGPRGTHRFEVQWRAFAVEQDKAIYAIYDQAEKRLGTLTLDMQVDAFGWPRSSCTASYGACLPVGADKYGFWANGSG
jgi:hypothetical protein